MMKRAAWTALAGLALGIAGAQPASAATIILNNIGGVGGSSPALQGFAAAANYWSKTLTNDVTIRLNVGYSSLGLDPNGNVILGSTRSVIYGVSTLDAYITLFNNANSALDVSAITTLPNLSDAFGLTVLTPGYTDDAAMTGIDTAKTVLDKDDTANNTSLIGTSANLKALGFGGIPDDAADATIQFSSDVDFDFDPVDGISAGATDFIGVAIHEMGHALGFVSGVDTYDIVGCPGGLLCSLDLDANNSTIGRILDLFRYSAAGDLDWRPGQEAYFSVDGGVTELFGNANMSTGSFNGDGNQASHWKANNSCGNFIGVMNPYLCDGTAGYVTAQDLGALDAIGWNLGFEVAADYRYTTAQAKGAVPEPATWLSMIAGLGLAGAALRRRRAPARHPA